MVSTFFSFLQEISQRQPSCAPVKQTHVILLLLKQHCLFDALNWILGAAAKIQVLCTILSFKNQYRSCSRQCTEIYLVADIGNNVQTIFCHG